MRRLYLVRHPATTVDRLCPPEEWQLSDEGGRQFEALLRQPFWRQVRHVYSSTEPKTATVAQKAAGTRGLPFSLHDDLRELRRSGFVPEYESIVERVFETPGKQVGGWESLESALRRVWRFLNHVAAGGLIPAAVVSHGIVLSAVRARLLGRQTPSLAEWQRLPFGGVADVDVANWRLLKDFAAPQSSETWSQSYAVIFDMDGVLVDSEPLTIRAYLQAAAEFGFAMDEREFIQHFVIEGTLIKSFFEEHAGGEADWEDFFQRKTEIYRELVRDELKLMPGAIALLQGLKVQNIPRALATSAARVSVELVLARFDLAPYFGATVTFEDVTHHKPDPQVFLKAAALLQTPPDRCIVIEDAPKGIAAAKAAGMKCVAVPTPLSRSSDLSAADLLVESLEHLTVEWLRALVGEAG